MQVPFGPQLIGEAEKTLNALLRRFLRDTGLTEPQWVVLRIAESIDAGSDEALIREAVERAHFEDAAELVAGLTRKGLTSAGRLTPVGRELTAEVRATIARETAPIWGDLPADDVAAATSLLNEVVARARAVLA